MSRDQRRKRKEVAQMKEKKRFLDTEAWKYIRTLMEILLFAAAIWGCVALWNWLNITIVK